MPACSHILCLWGFPYLYPSKASLLNARVLEGGGLPPRRLQSHEPPKGLLPPIAHATAADGSQGVSASVLARTPLVHAVSVSQGLSGAWSMVRLFLAIYVRSPTPFARASSNAMVADPLLHVSPSRARAATRLYPLHEPCSPTDRSPSYLLAAPIVSAVCLSTCTSGGAYSRGEVMLNLATAFFSV